MDKYQSIWETGDAFGHCGAALGASTLDAPYPTRESLDGTWAPYDPLDPDPSADQDCFGDSALEEILHHLGEGSEESPYDVAEGLVFLREPALLVKDEQLESAGPSYAVDSHQIPASDVLVKMRASRKHRVRGPKNWEFLMRLLVDPRANPALIEWEDEGQGIFRLRNPKAITQIWASRDGNSSDLSYNNFKRGLRWVSEEAFFW
ncbi:ETS-related transcription factor Elf-3-like [Macrobrachium rosenbergii]|uniref:ETS-related transcription factor Elf-3-like n=1 Tax=Macrobrachium rosenbergii TaxID=79674 RepID=UPI0034D3A433